MLQARPVDRRLVRLAAMSMHGGERRRGAVEAVAFARHREQSSPRLGPPEPGERRVRGIADDREPAVAVVRDVGEAPPASRTQIDRRASQSSFVETL